MSASKRKVAYDVRSAFSSIRDLLARVKSKLNGLGTSDEFEDEGSLRTDLDKVATLAESLNENSQRWKNRDGWADMADELDKEGTNLWNASVTIHHDTNNQERLLKLVSRLRLAAFRLIQAGLEPEPDADTLIHALQLASKTGASLSESGDHQISAQALSSAASLEEALRLAPESSSKQSPTAKRRDQVTLLYFSCRMEAAFREGNGAIAAYMLQKITDSDKRLLALPSNDIKVLVSKMLMIGKALLRPKVSPATQTQVPSNDTPGLKNDPHLDAKRAQEAVHYLQKAYAIVERAQGDDAGESAESGVRNTFDEIKRAVLRALSRAYYVSHPIDQENLARAETTIDELLNLNDPHSESKFSRDEYQQLKWIRLAIIKKRSASDEEMLSAFKSLIDRMSVDETNLRDVLLELRSLNPRRALVIPASRHLLNRTIITDRDIRTGTEFVAQVLLFLIFYCTKDQDLTSAAGEIAASLDDVNNANVTLSEVESASCLTLLWKSGEGQYTAKKYAAAAALFQLGTHKAFTALGQATVAKCCRKAAMAHLQQKEYARATRVVRLGDEQARDAGTCYILFLAALEQGLEEEAAGAIKRMAKAPNFDPRMIRLATQLAHSRRQRTLLLTVLDVLLSVVRGEHGPLERSSMDLGTEAVTLIRCLIRLVKELMADPAANRPTLLATIMRHFSTAIIIIEEAFSQKKEALIIKDISWLWRTAYNLAVEMCVEVGAANDQVTNLFDTAKRLLELHARVGVVPVGPEVYRYLAFVTFSALSGRVFLLRQRLEETQASQTSIRPVMQEITDCKALVKDLIDHQKIDDADQERIQQLMYFLHVFEVELICLVGDWSQVSGIVSDIRGTDSLAIKTLEAIADILWTHEKCPFDVLSSALEAILHASLNTGSLSTEKFARWLRAVCTLLLARADTTERTRAIGYIEQAVTAISDSGGDYPQDEREWLLATSYNTGVECLYASLMDESKRWLECAVRMCQHVPDGQRRKEKIQDVYHKTLEKLLT